MRREIVSVQDGRAVGVAWFGAPDGVPIVRLHGVAGSGTFEVEPAWTAEAGARVITLERPGFGQSEAAPIADVEGWAPDVATVADALGLDRFAIFAESAGGPHALAAARHLPDRVAAVALVGATPPRHVPAGPEAVDPARAEYAALAEADPVAAAAQARDVVARWHLDPRAALAAMVAGPDADVLAHPAWGADLVAQVAEGTRCPDGPAWDMVRINRPWGFDLSEIAQPVAVWQGRHDGLAPERQGRWLADQLPAGQLRLVDEHGHWLLYPCWREVVADLLALVRVP